MIRDQQTTATLLIALPIAIGATAGLLRDHLKNRHRDKEGW